MDMPPNVRECPPLLGQRLNRAERSRLCHLASTLKSLCGDDRVDPVKCVEVERAPELTIDCKTKQVFVKYLAASWVVALRIAGEDHLLAARQCGKHFADKAQRERVNVLHVDLAASRVR